MTNEPQSASGDRRELITFLVGEQDFCMDIKLVREIRGWTSVTALPHAPADVLGVMNLRGNVIPIVDLSERLGLGPYSPGESSVIVVAMIATQTVGFLVSAVTDIVGLSDKEIQPMPEVASGEARTFVSGIVTSRERTLRVLNVDALGATMVAPAPAA